ncbi:thioredoxin domain-containing protein [Desulfohalovibrio reitneri]|uniref:thioredoxin domain-containing protein n=1 Tax=Desulfohalovibrio reitneri TaxID=1307759 RepID=UPI0004A6B3FE|nr:thioredoxin domain-containing protein [Desulfohalovibrio reitneri]
MANRLANEKSPYLLQHKDNPVDWMPWGEEAFAEAKRRDKPLFVSIGYSTCHWCHVMERECFEDEEVAGLMNQHFVNVKVDREERPDVDSVYMTVCQMLTGSGGWPLNVVLTPDGQAFFAGTYFPKASVQGRIGMLELVPRLGQLWHEERERAVTSASQITEHLRKIESGNAGDGLGESEMRSCFAELEKAFDAERGGFGHAPKFPSPHNLLFLLRHARRFGQDKAVDMVEKTLHAMRLGGIHDHVGHGFHRYSTDREWLVPHFEKMLYDQAMLTMAYTEGYQATGDEAFRRTAGETIAYVLRELRDGEGGFLSAWDADSEGEEGLFYLWTEEEIRAALGPDSPEADLFIRLYNITSEGNYLDEATQRRTGRNIPHLTRPLDDRAGEPEMSADELREKMESIRQRLLAVRDERVRPHLDDKVLAEWNGLMIAALAKAAKAIDPAHAEHAARAADFVLSHMRDGSGRLLRRFRQGEAAMPATAADYACMAWGLAELYEATLEERWLEEAAGLAEDMIRHFWDEEEGGFFTTASDAENLLVRQKEAMDGAIPSGNSVAWTALLKLARMTERKPFTSKAEEMGRAFSAKAAQHPAAFTFLLCGADLAAGDGPDIVITGDRAAPETMLLHREACRPYLPDAVILFRDQVDPERIETLAPLTRGKEPADGRATAHVCRDKACRPPVTDPVDLVNLLAGEKGG